MKCARMLLLACLLMAPVVQAEDWLYRVKKGDTLWQLTVDYLIDISLCPASAEIESYRRSPPYSSRYLDQNTECVDRAVSGFDSRDQPVGFRLSFGAG